MNREKWKGAQYIALWFLQGRMKAPGSFHFSALPEKSKDDPRIHERFLCLGEPAHGCSS
jgi:hypothetical protein